MFCRTNRIHTEAHGKIHVISRASAPQPPPPPPPTTTTTTGVSPKRAHCFVASPFLMDPSEQPVSGAAQRRRQRLRSMLRHERMTVATALAEKLHHSSRGQRMARAGEEESEMKYTAKFRTTHPPQPVLFSLFEEEPGGGRPEAFVEPRPQARVQRHSVEHITDLVRVAPMVQILDAPVPQTGEQLPDILSFFGALLPDTEQVVEVPKTRRENSPYASGSGEGGEGVVVHVEVFMVHAQDRIQQRFWSRSLKFQFLRIDGKVAEVFKIFSQNRIQQRLWSRSLIIQLAEVFLIFSRDRVLLPHRGVCMTMRMRILQGFFALFPIRKKVRSWARTRGRNCSPSRAHPRGELMRTGMLLGELLAVFVDFWVSSSWTQLLTCPLLCMSGWSMLRAVHRRGGRPCAHAATYLQSWTQSLTCPLRPMTGALG